ncbi:MAG: flagellar export protein FliJ [Fidelibacterota bacterium]
MPNKFSFSLENILHYRKNLKDDKTLKLHNKKIELDNEESKLQNIKTLKEKTLSEAKTGNQNEQFSLLHRKIYDGYVDQINESIKKQHQRVDHSRTRVMQAKDDLNEETKKKKMLEKLKERQLETFKKELRRKEEKDNSEIALRKTIKSTL